MKKILVIEDEDSLLDIYTTKLKLEGFSVCTAKDGFEAQGLVLKERLDLILLDIILPHRDGFEFLTWVKKNRKTKNIPVVILSNLGQEYEIKRGLSLGAKKYLTKADYTPAAVVLEIKKVLGLK